MKGRSTYDIDSRRVLDTLYNSKIVDLACTYGWGDLDKTIGQACVGDIDGYVSAYNASVKLGNRNIQTLLKTLAKN
ncbi:MAG: hypothetical protein MJ096_01465 [Clostridia bacterium]|nr:hypothetical protein [Clostridia bacterium]